MTKTLDTSLASANTPSDRQSILDQISEIQSEAEKNKVDLTPEVREYIRTHIEAVQQKLANGEQVTEDDLRFMQDVRLWVAMPKEWRDKYRSIDEIHKAEEVQEIIIEAQKREINFHKVMFEANKRGIGPKQWIALLHVAESSDKDEKWIDETFKFPGDGRIETNGSLNLQDHTSLTFLPENLKVKGALFLAGCISLNSIPKGLSVNGNLVILYCTSLTSLPEDLEVKMFLYLSKDLHEQVKKDAVQLKEKGKIKNKVYMSN